MTDPVARDDAASPKREGVEIGRLTPAMLGLVCEWGGSGRRHVATTLVTVDPCGHRFYVCDAHRDEVSDLTRPGRDPLYCRVGGQPHRARVARFDRIAS